MRTQAHRIVDTDPKRGNVVVRLTDPPRRARRAAVSVLSLIVFHIALGWKVYSLSKGPYVGSLEDRGKG